MKIPHKITINQIPWTVTVDEPLDPADEGATYTSRLEIRINGEVNEDKHDAIFWHELIHAICNSREINVKRDIKTEEDLARLLGPALLEFFATNAEIIWKEPNGSEEEKHESI